MWAMGPPNHVKDGIQPLVGLVETDWLPFPFTMNWHLHPARPGALRQGRAVLLHHPGRRTSQLESFELVQQRLEADDDAARPVRGLAQPARRLQRKRLPSATRRP